MTFKQHEFDPSRADPIDIPLVDCRELPYLQRFFRRPYTLKTAKEIGLAHSRPGYMFFPVQLLQVPGYMAFNIDYNSTPMTIHPVGLYDGEGTPCRFPTKDVIRDPKGVFAYMLQPKGPMRSREDVQNRAIAWTRFYVDSRPQAFSPY